MALAVRQVVDCRLYPSEKKCTLTIAGTADEVFTVAVRHAIQEHGHADTPDLREGIRSLMKPE